MKFLADENFPMPSVKLLRQNLFDVASVLELFQSATDKYILNYAIENNLIILTFDRDYGELIFKYAITNPPSVIYFRAFNDTPVQSAEKLIALLNNTFIFENYFTVIDSNAIRQRKLI